MEWYEPKDPAPREQCPCCGYVSLPERGMSLICRVCFWEDDAFVGDVLDCDSLCNHMTLRQARSNFVKIGACEPEMLVHVIPESERVQFDWRPLSVEESES